MFVCVCLERESESRGVASEDVMEKSLKIKMKHRKCSQLSLIAVCVCVCARDRTPNGDFLSVDRSAPVYWQNL